MRTSPAGSCRAAERGAWRLRTQAARHAAALRAAGVQPGDRVLVQAEKSPEFLLLYLGCLRAGAVFVPLNTAYTAAEVRYFATDSEPRVMVCDPARTASLAEVAAACGARLRTLDAAGQGSWSEDVAAAAPSAGGPVPRAVDDLAAILYTSGTTGRSKGAMLSHGNLAANARTLVALWRFAPADVLLHALPIYHVHGLFIATHCALLAAATTQLLPRFDVATILGLLPRSTVFMGVPTYYVRLLEDPGFDRACVRGMRVFICGSAPLLPATFEEFERRTGQPILERYGMTEAGMITSNPYDDGRIAGSVGFAPPDVAVRVAGPDGVELPRGEPGVLEIRSRTCSGAIGGCRRRPPRSSAPTATSSPATWRPWTAAGAWRSSGAPRTW